MSRQHCLFEIGAAAWIVRVWSTMPSEKREETLSVLAEMARDALAARAKLKKKGEDDES